MALTLVYQDTFDGAALDPAWVRQGVASETVANGQLSATLAGGQGYSRTLADCNLGSLSDYTIELALASDANLATMIGPTVLDDSGFGINLSWFNNPSGLLYLSVSNWIYPGGFATAFSGVGAFPDRIRLRKSGTNWYASHSTDGGVTWSAEAAAWGRSFTPTRVGFVNVANGSSGAIVVDQFSVYADLNPTAQPSNLTVVSFSGGAHLKWSPDPNAQSYQYRVDGGAWTTVTTAEVAITGLTNGTAYTVDIQAVNALGVSPSATTTVTPSPSLLYDDFNRPNSATSPGSPVQGGPYTVQLGTFGIQNGQLYAAASVGEAHLTFPSASDFDFTMRPTVFGGDMGMLFRWTDTNNTWLFQCVSGTSLRFYRRKGGTWSRMANDIPRTVVPGDILRVVGLGKYLWCFHNDLMLFAEIDDHFNPAAPAPTCGFRISSETVSRIDEVIVKPATVVPVSFTDGTLADDVLTPPLASRNDQVLLYKGRDSKLADEGAVA